MQAETPLVSIFAVCYNHRKWLQATLESIRKQDYPNLEILIVDDCSTDGSATEIVNWLQNQKVDAYFIAHQKNKGLCAGLNEMLRRSNGRYIKPIACDDVLYPNMISRMVDLLEKNPNAAVSCSNFETIDSDGNIIQKQYFPDAYAFPEDVFSAILTGHQGLPIVIHSPTGFIRKQALLDVGGYRDDLLQEDFDMWLKLSLNYKVVYIPEVLVSYRQLNSSLSKQLITKKRIRYLEDHLKVIDDLCEIVDGRKKDVLYSERLKRIQKMADVLFTKVSSAGEAELELQRLIKVIIQKHDVNDRVVQKALAHIYYLSWQKGRSVLQEEKHFLKHLKWKHRIQVRFNNP